MSVFFTEPIVVSRVIRQSALAPVTLGAVNWKGISLSFPAASFPFACPWAISVSCGADEFVYMVQVETDTVRNVLRKHLSISLL